MDEWTRFSKGGIYGDPNLATAEKGRIIFEAVVTSFVKLVREFKNRPLGRTRIITTSAAPASGCCPNTRGSPATDRHYRRSRIYRAPVRDVAERAGLLLGNSKYSRPTTRRIPVRVGARVIVSTKSRRTKFTALCMRFSARQIRRYQFCQPLRFVQSDTEAKPVRRNPWRSGYQESHLLFLQLSGTRIRRGPELHVYGAEPGCPQRRLLECRTPAEIGKRLGRKTLLEVPCVANLTLFSPVGWETARNHYG